MERLTAQVSALVRDEVALATAEMKRKGARAGIGGAGAVVALLGLDVLRDIETVKESMHR